MTKVINYDHSVKNLIDELSATGHVTHRSYKKTSVTLHHNAGRLSHEGVLNVWKVRPASAHFDSDTRGEIAQYVKVNEYAWAAGNTVGNMESIHIEMANAATGGDWPVSEVTWKAAARLAGWLFAKVIGTRPTRNNLHYHHHWASTACAGPYMDTVYEQVLDAAQKSYDYFKGVAPRPARPDRGPRKSNTQIAAEVWAGKWGSGDVRRDRLTAAGYNANTIQKLVNQGVGRNAGNRPAPDRPARKSITTIAAEVIDGEWGNGAARRHRLARAGYNATSVQTEVNRQLGVGNHKSISQLASEVIAGKWGNGAERTRRLVAAGYSAQRVQAEVNRRLA